MSDEERPVHHEYDCATGETTITPLTDEEWEEHKQREIADKEMIAKEAADEDALREAVRNHEDPVVKALGAKLGYV